MEDQQKKLLEMLSNALFENGEKTEPTEAVLHEARQQAVSSLIYTNYAVISKNITVDYAHAELTEVLKGIPFVTLKGYASAYYYPKPELRPMGDVDFYVSTEYYDIAVEKLIKAGYIQIEHEHERHIAFDKDRIEFELHSEIKGIPNGKDGIIVASENAERIVRAYLNDIIETAKTVETEYGEVIIPDEFHHGLIMLLHVAGHIINDGGVGLRHLCDWAVYADKVDISKYKTRFVEMGLWTFACELTAISTKYLGLRKTDWCTEYDESFLSQFISDIISAGNFGRKDLTRNAGNNIIKKDNYISSLAYRTRSHFGFTRSYPILLPFGMIAYACRFIWLRLTGKREWVTSENIRDAKERKKLYEQFKLFEVE